MNFIKTTLVGGFLLLVPIAVCVLILGKVYRLMARVAAPLAEWVPIDSIGGVAKANLLAIIAMVLICFAAGLISKSLLASGLVKKMESGLLQSIPGYTFIKNLTHELTGGGGEQLAPVLARFDDAWQIAFHVEDLSDGRIVLFIPGAPDPWSGSIMIMSSDRVQKLDRTMTAAVRNIRALGRGSGELFSKGSVERQDQR